MNSSQMYPSELFFRVRVAGANGSGGSGKITGCFAKSR